MERKEALECVRKQMTEQRYLHTLGVMEMAVTLANLYGVDEKKAELAAVFHDYAKFRPIDEMRGIIIEQRMPSDLLLYNSELWHAPVGAFLVEKEAGITDLEILSAIRFHTSGRQGMTKLEKIIYLADYIEPSRRFHGVLEVRELAKSNLENALIKAVQNTIQFLVKMGKPIYPDTFYAYNDLVKNLED